MEAAVAGGRSPLPKLFGAYFQHRENNERFPGKPRPSLSVMHSRNGSMPAVGATVYDGVGESVGNGVAVSTGGKKRRSFFRFLGGRKYSGGSATAEECISAAGLTINSAGSRGELGFIGGSSFGSGMMGGSYDAGSGITYRGSGSGNAMLGSTKLSPRPRTQRWSSMTGSIPYSSQSSSTPVAMRANGGMGAAATAGLSASGGLEQSAVGATGDEGRVSSAALLLPPQRSRVKLFSRNDGGKWGVARRRGSS